MDKAKDAEYYKKAAMQGHAKSRYNLGCFEISNGNHGRAVRHLLISVKMEDERSVDAIKKGFIAGQATKEQYTQALNGYQDAVAETKSHDRDEAKRFCS